MVTYIESNKIAVRMKSSITRVVEKEGENKGQKFIETIWEPIDFDPFAKESDLEHKKLFFGKIAETLGKLYKARESAEDKDVDAYKHINKQYGKKCVVTFDKMFTIPSSRTSKMGAPRNTLTVFMFVSPVTGLMDADPIEEARRIITQVGGVWLEADNSAPQNAPSTATPPAAVSAPEASDDF